MSTVSIPWACLDRLVDDTTVATYSFICWVNGSILFSLYGFWPISGPLQPHQSPTKGIKGGVFCVSHSHCTWVFYYCDLLTHSLSQWLHFVLPVLLLSNKWALHLHHSRKQNTKGKGYVTWDFSIPLLPPTHSFIDDDDCDIAARVIVVCWRRFAARRFRVTAIAAAALGRRALAGRLRATASCHQRE